MALTLLEGDLFKVTRQESLQTGDKDAVAEANVYDHSGPTFGTYCSAEWCQTRFFQLVEVDL